MTVQQLINRLMLVENKDQQVFCPMIADTEEQEFTTVDIVETDEDTGKLLIY